MVVQSCSSVWLVCCSHRSNSCCHSTSWVPPNKHCVIQRGSDFIKATKFLSSEWRKWQNIICRRRDWGEGRRKKKQILFIIFSPWTGLLVCLDCFGLQMSKALWSLGHGMQAEQCVGLLGREFCWAETKTIPIVQTVIGGFTKVDVSPSSIFFTGLSLQKRRYSLLSSSDLLIQHGITQHSGHFSKCITLWLFWCKHQWLGYLKAYNVVAFWKTSHRYGITLTPSTRIIKLWRMKQFSRLRSLLLDHLH